MFKCEVKRIRYSLNLQETAVAFRISNIGNPKTPNHRLLNTHPDNSHFIVGEIDRSIKVGDLLRCDGLPFTSKPVRTINSKYTYDSNKIKRVVQYVYDLPEGYRPFQLDSGYWVLRRK